MTTLPNEAIEAVARRVNPEAWAEIPPEDAPENWEEISSVLRQRSMDRAEVYILAALPHLGEPVAWCRKWNYHGHPNDDEFTDRANLAEQWRTHPQTDAVVPLYLAPPAPAVAIKPLEWRRVPMTASMSRAVSPIGDYQVWPHRDPNGIWFWAVDRSKQRTNEAHGEDGAKSAAQADYEARIRSVLVDAPAAAPEPPVASVPETPDSSPAAHFAGTKEWFEKRAAQEGDLDVRAGKRVTSTIDLTPDELAELERLLPRRPADPLIEQMAEALKPFAVDADEWADTVPDDHRSLCTEPGSQTAHPGSETKFTVGDLRHARAALDAYKASKEEHK